MNTIIPFMHQDIDDLVDKKGVNVMNKTTAVGKLTK